VGQSCRDLFSFLSPLSAFQATTTLHASQDPEPILPDVHESSNCVSRNDKDVKSIAGRN
jgi:hypothetical protein